MSSDSSWWWATVTSAAPLRIRRDGEVAALPVTPDTLKAGLVVGDRVYCHRSGQAVVIIGRSGG